ncbi:hypothetical protein ZHAS_00015496 [Anopheles sinensis]|uniref:Uncharacterized protein n=1 Tax=Anopheles sinensis TaxID=74873 RepID=A0A084WBE1_ANOSI|nr:hypothetical protein ZHAS_00015496 [Anopheles sinensis]
MSSGSENIAHQINGPRGWLADDLDRLQTGQAKANAGHPMIIGQTGSGRVEPEFGSENSFLEVGSSNLSPFSSGLVC